MDDELKPKLLSILKAADSNLESAMKAGEIMFAQITKAQIEEAIELLSKNYSLTT